MKKCGIRAQVAWLTLLPLLVLVIGMESFFLHERYVDLDRDLLTRGQLIARQLAASSEYGVFASNAAFLSGIAESALGQPDVEGVVVLNAASKVLVNTGVFQGDAMHSTARLSRVSSGTPVFDDGKTLLLYQPIISSQLMIDGSDFQPDLRPAGAVIIDMSWEETRHLKSRLLWFTLSVTGIFLLVTLYLVHLASRSIIEPIKRLSEAIQLIGAGHLETRVIVPSRINELCTLTCGINQMTADLQHERNILQQRIDEATQQLHGLAFYDNLTGLPNRRLLNDRLTQALANSKRSGHYGAVMFLDLDNFKPLNDQFGHAVGDLLLIEVARRISRCLRETDTVARFGGDEFVVMLSRLDVDYAESVSLAHNVAEKIHQLLAEGYCLSYRPAGQREITVEHDCTSSIGVVLFLDHENSQEEILSWADAAMYQAKKEGRNRICIYEQSQTETTSPPFDNS